MRPEIQHHETRKKWLERGIKTLAAPFQPLFMMERGIAWADKQFGQIYIKIKNALGLKSASSEQIHTSGIRQESDVFLPAENPVAQKFIEIAGSIGVQASWAYVRDLDKPMTNAEMSAWDIGPGKQTKMGIVFYGNPEDSSIDPDAVIGTLGHEVGHTLTSSTCQFENLIKKSNRMYSKLAWATASLGALSHYLKTADETTFVNIADMALLTPIQLAQVLQSMPPSMLLYSCSAIALATGYSMRYMQSKHSMSTEHLCDLHGSELTSPENTIKSLQRNKHIRKFVQERSTILERLKIAWEDAIHPENNTHPSQDDRISLIRKSFNMTNDASNLRPIDQPPKPPAPPPSQQP